MITISNNTFKLDTLTTSYIFTVLPSGHLENLYYGKLIKNSVNYSALSEKRGDILGTSISYSTTDKSLILDNICLEVSTAGKGDFREPYLILSDNLNNIVNNFLFKSYKVHEEVMSIDTLPCAYGQGKTLEVELVDSGKNLILKLFYSLFDDCDVIVRSSQLINNSDSPISINRMSSLQLDLPYCDYNLLSLDGAWIRERYINSRPISYGVTTIDSKSGISSNRHNPYVVLSQNGASLNNGNAIGTNLIYSGNHFTSVEVSSHGKTRIINGINDFGFNWTLDIGASFFTPQATMCFSYEGTNGLSRRYHKFINQHIVRGSFANKPRPILINNWEATYFNFTEKKLLEIAKSAADLGIELFVLDDGWFGDRKDDHRSLGDWEVNNKKLPLGLKGLSSKINKLGLKFGLWVEPEMINPDSDTYRAHPDWAIEHPSYMASLGRNQLVLDLTREDVRQFIKDFLTKIISSGNIEYIKWDFNRPMSDFYCASDNHGEFFHRYTLGLYEILEYITKKFDKVLFESCASGGNRVDLGMLCYFPQYWASDNTDSYDRNLIQTGTLSCYPQSSMGSHVSAAPNHQTLRQSMIENRFNTASIGVLGYELDLTELANAEYKQVKEQIEFYKKYRNTLQYGTYYVLSNIFTENKGSWIVVSPDKSQAIAYICNKIAPTNPASDILKTVGLDDNKLYKITTRQQAFNIKVFGDLINRVLPVTVKQDGKIHDMLSNNFALKSEIETYTVYGDLLNNCGIKLSQQFSGSGYNEHIRVMMDFGSRLYIIEESK